MTQQSRQQIDNKFYKLQNEEWVKACRELKPAEKDVLYYLRTLDPFGDKELDLSVTAIANVLGKAKSTVSKALKVLDAKGWINIELVQIKAKVKSFPTGNNVSHRKQCFPQETPVSYRKPQFPTGNPSFLQETPVSYRKRSEVETIPMTDFQNSKTIKTIKTLHTLSENERVKFKAFCERKARQYDKPIVLIEKWINKNFEELYRSYLEVYGEDKSSAVPSETKNFNPALEKAIAAKEKGLIQDIYWSSIHNCDAVVLPHGEPIPLHEWFESLQL